MIAQERRSRHHRWPLRRGWPVVAVLVLLLADYGLLRSLVVDRALLLVRGKPAVARVSTRDTAFTREPTALSGHASYVVTYTFAIGGQTYGHRQEVSKQDFDSMPRGASVRIIYDPDHPQDSALSGSVRPLGVIASAIILLAANGLPAVALLARTKPRRGGIGKPRA